MPLHFRPNPEKIVELLLHLAHTAPGMDVYHAVKMFYLADREHLLRYGRPITQELYVAMDYGPVASTVLDIFNGNEGTMNRYGIKDLPFTIEEQPRAGAAPIPHLAKPSRSVDTSIFSKTDLRVVDEIVEKYGKLSFQQLFELTHNHFAYKRAWEERAGKKMSPMKYEEMIESPDERKRIVEDIGPVSFHF